MPRDGDDDGDERDRAPTTNATVEDDGRTDPDTTNRGANRASAEWTCHYCGRQFADPERAAAAHDDLVRHLERECQRVPGPVRARYRASCPGGNCNV